MKNIKPTRGSSAFTLLELFVVLFVLAGVVLAFARRPEVALANLGAGAGVLAAVFAVLRLVSRFSGKEDQP